MNVDLLASLVADFGTTIATVGLGGQVLFPLTPAAFKGPWLTRAPVPGEPRA